tara:strand:- start:1547 stop:1879 length:333 start_codon:yes stop_codon:yes gene_type:complete
MATLPEHRITKDAVIDQYKRVENGRERLYSNIPIQELREAVGMLNDYAELQRASNHIFIGRHIDRICDSLTKVKDYFADVVEQRQIREQLGEVTYEDYIFITTIKGVTDG